jgi:hypothetical protein
MIGCAQSDDGIGVGTIGAQGVRVGQSVVIGAQGRGDMGSEL